MIATSSDNQRTFWPFLFGNDAVALYINYLWLDDGQTSNSARMPTKDMRTSTSGEIPYPDGAICGATDKGVFGSCQGPNTTIVALEGAQELACDRRIYMDGMVVRGRDDTAVGEDEAGNDG
jgi:hypothetical protein